MSLTLSPTDWTPFTGQLAGLLSLALVIAIAQGARWLTTWRRR